MVLSFYVAGVPEDLLKSLEKVNYFILSCLFAVYKYEFTLHTKFVILDGGLHVMHVLISPLQLMQNVLLHITIHSRTSRPGDGMPFQICYTSN